MVAESDGYAVTESLRASGGKVLVFCKAGISRSAAICIAYLMQQNSLTMDEAHDYVKSRRTFISPNLNFMRQLHEFDGRLRADRSRSTVDDRPPTVCASTAAAAGPYSPTRPVLRSLQCPTIDHRRRWLSTTPTFPVDCEAFPRTTRRASSAVPRYLDVNSRWSELSLTVGRSRPTAALLSIVSPGFRLSNVWASVIGERPICRRDRLSASTPSQISRPEFIYPFPLNANANKSSLISL